MAIYQQSPGVQVVEKDASAVTVGLSTTVGAYVGAYNWGPVMQPMLISDEGVLVNTFGTPDASTFAHFYAAANLLTYTNAMYVNRAVGTLAKNATVSGTGILIKNAEDYQTVTTSSAGTFAARYAGTKGSGLKVSIADSGTFATWFYRSNFSAAPATSEYAAARGGLNDEIHVIVIDGLGKFTGTPGTVLEKYEFLSKGSDAISYQGTNNYYKDVLTNRSQYVYWTAHDADGTNWGNTVVNTTFTSLTETAVTVTPTATTWSAGTVTLTYTALGSAPYLAGEQITVSDTAPVGYNGTFTVVSSTTTETTYALATNPGTATVQGSAIGTSYDFDFTLSGGVDSAPTEAELQLGWDLFLDTQTYNVSLLVSGNATIALAAYIVQNIADVRKDCVAFTSITASTSLPTEPILGSSSTRIVDAKAFKTFNSSYAVIDSGYKYMYDKYNDKYRWIALNADIAGLCARVDATNDTWFSPAGMVKGQIKGAVKLSWNPTQAERDQLYPYAINPVINQVGQGTILFGDKTATLKPSAFDRINVRRLFLILERSIQNSAKFQLFEINDAITRLQFVASVEPFLRDVKGRRGMQEYKVICDETNNTPQVVATNNFVGTILIKPNYSINFITLNFVAVGPNVSFDIAAGV
jgi:hypothetical protein